MIFCHGNGATNKRNTPILISFFKEMNVIDVFAFYYQSFVLLSMYRNTLNFKNIQQKNRK